MNIVVDSNLLVALVFPLPYSSLATQLMAAWKDSGETIAAPALQEYEITTALRKAIFLQRMTMDDAKLAIDTLLSVGVQRHSPTPVLDKRSLEWADFIGQSKAYDAQYLALAERLQADFWTADQRLARNANQAGASWVHWIGELNDT